VLRNIISPGAFTTVAALGGMFWKLFTHLKKSLINEQKTALQTMFKSVDDEQNRMLKELHESITRIEKDYSRTQITMRKDLLKLQILEAIDAEETPREVLYHFDQYKKLGGNSYIDEKVRAYLKRYKSKYPDDI